MSDPYAPPGSRRDASGGAATRERPPGPPGGQRPAPHEPQGRPPDRLPERRPPDPDGALRAARLSLRFLLLVLCGLVALMLPLPWQAASLAFLVVGAVVGVRALVVAVRARVRGPVLAAVVVGLVLTALLVLGAVGQLVLWPVAADHQRCEAQALTQSAQRACDAQQQDEVARLLGMAGASR